MDRATFSLALLHPKYWFMWLGFALLYLVVQCLPFKAIMWLGAKLGRLAAAISDRRRMIARKNIALCFPDLSEQERERLFYRSMESVGQGLMDSGIAWFWPKWRLNKILDVEGQSLLFDTLEKEQGILFFSYHFTSLEIALASMNRLHPQQNYGVYRPHANKVYEYVMRKGRERHGPDTTALPKSGVRTMVKALRKGKIVFYIPDQDYGRRYSVFVPFMGVEAATVTAPSQLAKMGRAKVLSFCAFRKHDGSGYSVKIYPELEGYGEDEQADALQLNQFLQGLIEDYPEQYLWVHRRFKSRPDGERNFYQLDGLKSSQRRRKRRVKLKEKRAAASDKAAKL